RRVGIVAARRSTALRLTRTSSTAPGSNGVPGLRGSAWGAAAGAPSPAAAAGWPLRARGGRSGAVSVAIGTRGAAGQWYAAPGRPSRAARRRRRLFAEGRGRRSELAAIRRPSLRPSPMPPLKTLALGDLDHELTNTRRVLERLPDAHFDWRPH